MYLLLPDGKELARKLLSQGLNVVIVARFGLSLMRSGSKICMRSLQSFCENVRNEDAVTVETCADSKGDEPVFAETLKDMPNRLAELYMIKLSFVQHIAAANRASSFAGA